MRYSGHLNVDTKSSFFLFPVAKFFFPDLESVMDHGRRNSTILMKALLYLAVSYPNTSVMSYPYAPKPFPAGFISLFPLLLSLCLPGWKLEYINIPRNVSNTSCFPTVLYLIKHLFALPNDITTSERKSAQWSHSPPNFPHYLFLSSSASVYLGERYKIHVVSMFNVMQQETWNLRSHIYSHILKPRALRHKVLHIYVTYSFRRRRSCIYICPRGSWYILQQVYAEVAFLESRLMVRALYS